MHDAIVIGGGIAGLTAAFDLMRAGLDVVVLEESTVAGGNIRTVTRDGYRFEYGPHSFMGLAESVWQLILELGASDDVEPASPAAAHRYIYRDGRLMSLPTSAVSFLGSGVLSLRGKFRLAIEPFIGNGADPEETAWEFFSRRFGDEAATYIMSPFISGVYAGDIHALGARAAFPKFWGFENEKGSMILGAMRYMREKRKRLRKAGEEPRRGLFSTSQGLGGLVSRVSDALGERLRLGVRVSSVKRCGEAITVISDQGEVVGRTVIVAVPPHRAAPILRRATPRAAEALLAIPMAPVALVQWACSNASGNTPSGFGFLVPRVEGVRVLGTLFPSQLFDGRAPDGRHLFASYYGGTTDSSAMALSDEELKELVFTEHEAILGIERKSSRVLDIVRYRAAIPQLLPDHPELVASIVQEIESVSGMTLAGNYLTGVGIEAAVESGYEAASRCRRILESGHAASTPSRGSEARWQSAQGDVEQQRGAA